MVKNVSKVMTWVFVGAATKKVAIARRVVCRYMTGRHVDGEQKRNAFDRDPNKAVSRPQISSATKSRRRIERIILTYVGDTINHRT